MSPRQNVYGQELTEPQERLAQCYDGLAGVLRDHRDELDPFEERNAIKAVAALWHVMNGLDLEPSQPYDLGA